MASSSTSKSTRIFSEGESLFPSYDVAAVAEESNFQKYFSKLVTPTARTTRTALNSVASTAAERQIMTSADGGMIPIVYGRQRVGGKIALIKEDAGYLYVLAIWCLGLCESVESILFNGEEIPGNIVANYLGTTTQAADSTLAGIITGYSDDLVITKNGEDTGVCYSVLKVVANEFPSSIEAIIQGKHVYDPRTTSTDYSTNPALCLADFISSNIYGQGRTVNMTALEDVADDNDTTLNSVKRRELNYYIDRPAKTVSHVNALRAYVGCFVVVDDTVKLISDKVVATSRAITVSDIVDGSLKIKKSGTANIPTVVKVIYTDTTAEPWRDAEATAETIGLTERRESTVHMQGITTHAQAYREAVERLNALTLSDLTVEWLSFDESLADQVGDVVEVTHPKGLTSKKLRILSVTQAELGRYRIYGAEYDPAVYSDAVVSEPTHPDTTIPNPNDPTPPTAVTATEELFQQISQGTYASRLRISWTAPSYPYIQYYRVVVKVLGYIVFEATTTSTEIVTGQVLELKQHDIEVYTFSGLTYSSSATQIITPQGKYLPPDDVADLTGFEAGGTVYLSWSQVFDIDMFKYEVRYGATSVTWADATILDRIDALRITTDEVAAGTWDFLVKALDSVGNYSDTEARKTLTVTIDANAFLVDTINFDSPVTETNLHQYTLERSGDITYDVSESTQSWATLFPNAMSTYTNAINSYQSDLVSEYLSETNDFGLELSGNWTADLDYTAISGTVTAQLELSTDNFTSDTQIFTSLTAKATARYSRIRVKSDTGLFIINWPTISVRVDAIPRAENGDSTSLSSGGKTITLNNDYASVKSLLITPVGTSALTAVVDNVSVSTSTDSFDVYIFNASGIQVANDFLWKFEGV